MGIASAATFPIIVKLKNIQPWAKIEVKVRGPRMKRRRQVGSTSLGKIMKKHTSSESVWS